MDHASKKELITIVNKQKEDLIRYKNRLSDIVTAYKGLVKEKEALESSLKAITQNEPTTKSSKEARNLSETESERSSSSNSNSNNSNNIQREYEQNKEKESVSHLKAQIATLMNSLATLSAEKSRMEAGFQADRRQLRTDIEQRDRKLKEQEDRLQEIKRSHGIELEEMKSKLIIERHERDREQSDHAAMIKEFQKLLSDERRARESLELRLAEIESSEGDPNEDSKSLTETSPEPVSALLFAELHQEMTRLKNQHEAAIQEEKRRQAEIESRAHRLAAAHEKRVASLEARLAELSKTVGDYDRLRHQDQQAILKLKEKLSQLDRGSSESGLQEQDVQTLIERILSLKEHLIALNERTKNPLDVFAILNAEGLFLRPKDSHSSCQEAFDKLEMEFDLYKKQHRSNINHNNRQDDAEAESAQLREQISRLQTRNRTLCSQLEECQNEARSRLNEQHNLLKTERAKLNERLRATEAEWRSRVAELDQQVHSQRERSLRLLEEKEQEITTLKSAFAMFVPGHKNNSGESSEVKQSLDAIHSAGDTTSSSTESNPHMLHYAHELARKDVELGQTRRARLRLEGQLREAKREVATEAERHRREVKSLSEELSRLERCQSRESANLEYLKNVFVSYLSSKNGDRRRHMLNAIAAVLRFSDSELERLTTGHSIGS